MKNKIARASFSLIHLFALVLFVGMVYWFRLLFQLNEFSSPINHFYAISGGLCIWLGFLWMMSNLGSGGKEYHFRKQKLFVKIISIIGMFNMIGVFLMGFFILMSQFVLNATPIQDEAERLRVTGLLTISLKIGIPMLIYAILCFVFIWTRYIVKENKLVILNNKVLYPGTKYTMLPFLIYESNIIDQSIAISINNLSVYTRNTTVTADIETEVKLRLDDAAKRKIKTFDPEQFIKQAQNWISSLISREAKDRTFTELVQAELPSVDDDVNGFPATWAGEATYII